MPEGTQHDSTGGVRKILVGTDFSEASARARDYALSLAAPGATMTLVHAHLLPLPEWPEPPYVPGWMPAEPSVREQTLERLRLFAAPARAVGLAVETVLEEGLPADVILARAETLKPDLIALGTHGRRGFERWVMGSTAERVLRLAPTAVLTVSAPGLGPSPARIREVLCALSLAPGSEETASFASELAHRTQSALPILHVVESSRFQASEASLDAGSRARLAAAAERGPFAPTLVRSGQPSQEILRTAAERGVDLIVMGVHDRGPASRGLFGSTADRVVREATCAVVTVRRAAVGKVRAPTPGASSSREQLA